MRSFINWNLVGKSSNNLDPDVPRYLDRKEGLKDGSRLVLRAKVNDIPK
jgi:hypothetical protein